MTDLITLLTALSTKYGPAFVDLAMTAIRLHGVAGIVAGLVCGAVATASAFVLRWAALRDMNALPVFMIGWCASIMLFLSAIGCVICLLDVWNWVAIFSPETYAAAKLLHLGGVK